jgi:5,10-methylenetetrahydromethanopterin reductase
MRKFGIEFVPVEVYWKTTFYAIQAEKLGYDSIWITDHFNNRNVYVTLSYISNYTTDIHLGPGVTNPYLIHPVVTAQSVASLNEVAPSRVHCGIGAGDKTTLELAKVELKNPITTVKEAVEIIRHQLSREKEGYRGKIFQLTPGSRLNFKVNNEIPIYIGAQGPMMLELTGEIADGALINASHPDDIREAIDLVKKGLKKANRRREEIDIAVFTSFSIAEKEELAKKSAAPAIAYIVAGSNTAILEKHGISLIKAGKIKEALVNRRWDEAFSAVNERMINAFSISGTPEQCLEKIDNLFKMGINHFIAGSPIGPNIRRSINLFGNEVLPLLS